MPMLITGQAEYTVNQLVQQSVSSPQFNEVFNINGLPGGFGYVANFSVYPDSRALDLSSDLDPTTSKGAGGVPVQNQTPSNTLEVDTISGPVEVSRHLTGDLIGNWSSGTTLRGTLTYNIIPTSSTPYTQTLSVSATDPVDGATATATANIIEHLPVEPQAGITTIPSRELTISQVLSGVSPGIIGWTVDSEGNTLESEEVIEGAAALATVYGEDDASGVLEGFAKIGAPLAGYIGYGDEPGGTAAENDATTWSVAQSIDGGNVCYSTPYYTGENPNHVPVSLLNTSDGWKLCSMSVSRMRYYNIEVYQADGYTLNGFTGSIPWVAYNNYTSDVDEPFFTQIQQ